MTDMDRSDFSEINRDDGLFLTLLPVVQAIGNMRYSGYTEADVLSPNAANISGLFAGARTSSFFAGFAPPAAQPLAMVRW
jgi:hypothetical protein